MNKMNLPPPFGPERKRPEFPSSSEAVKSDDIKYYGPNLLKQQGGEEEEDEDVQPIQQDGTSNHSLCS